MAVAHMQHNNCIKLHQKSIQLHYLPSIKQFVRYDCSITCINIWIQYRDHYHKYICYLMPLSFFTSHFNLVRFIWLPFVSINLLWLLSYTSTQKSFHQFAVCSHSINAKYNTFMLIWLHLLCSMIILHCKASFKRYFNITVPSWPNVWQSSWCTNHRYFVWC